MLLLDGQDPEKKLTFLEQAEEYYGDSGTLQVATLHVSWADPDKMQLKAGESVTLNVAYTLKAAATYSYTYQMQPLFDDYRDTKIILTLPAGVSVSGHSGIVQTDNQCTLNLDDSISAHSDVTRTITLTLTVDGNGTHPIGEELHFGSQIASLETSFEIMDRTDPGNSKPSGREYTKTVTAADNLGTKTLTTDDVWGIEKSVKPYSVSDDKTSVTVSYDLTIGLLEGENIVTNPASYGRSGRVPFGGDVTLTETPSVSDREGTPIAATSITVTPQFGGQEPIEVTSADRTVTLPVDTCAGKESVQNVDGGAPYLSTYLVEVVYPYEKFIAQYHEENQDKLTVENKAKISYKLLGGEEQTAEDTANIEVGEVTQPAQITISKYLVHGTDSKLYSAANYVGSAVTGPAAFTITKDGDEGATIYILEDGKYKVQTGNTVTIDPKGNGPTNGTDGTITVYLDPGTYTITESDSLPANTQKITGGANNSDEKTVTVTVDSPGTADFYNKELLGSITLTKYGRMTGQNDAVLGGAAFGLYKDKACNGEPIQQATSDDHGQVVFSGLPYGTYYVKEISAPDGYIRDNTVYPFTIGEDNDAAAEKVYNDYNLAPVVLQKQMFNGTGYENVGSNDYRDFAGAFTLQRKTDENDWVDVERFVGQGLSEFGTWSLTLPVYDDQGELITYRFKEAIPTGWYAPSGATVEPDGRTMYSKEFDLKAYLGKPLTSAREIVMQNDRNGSITVTKQFYKVTGTGAPQVEADQQVTFQLYRSTDGKTATAYGSAVSFAGKYTFEDLPRTDSSGTDYRYYPVELPVSGYTPDTSIGTVSLNIDGKTVTAWDPYTSTAEDDTPAQLDYAVTVKNYSQELPVIVKKENSITGGFVSGAKFTVCEYDNDQKGEVVIQETEITAAGTTIYLQAGKKYLVEETMVPTGYKDVTEESLRIIDLTGYTPVNSETQYTMQTVTLKNQPDPELLVTKTLKGNNTTQTLTNVNFEVYTKGEGDTFQQVNGYDKQPLTITAGTAQQLPTGTYYLKEIVPEGSNILDPSTHYDLYGETDGELVNDTFYFGPIPVEAATTQQQQTQKEITNYSKLGAVTVTKLYQAAGKNEPLAGAVIGIYNGETLVGQATSGADGKVTFKDLPIYGGDGQKITYTIKEITAPDGYTLSTEELSVTLTPGQTVTTDTQNQPLEIVNLPKVDFKVTKVFYHKWEHEFTGVQFTLPGAQIALYRQNENGNYTFVKMLTTDIYGEVTFQDLDREGDYVAVEYGIPNDPAYVDLEPIHGEEYLGSDYPEEPPKTLEATGSDKGCLERYYSVEMPKPVPGKDMVAATMTNVEHWAQLNILKYVMRQNQEDPPTETKQPVNNAEFQLYQQRLPEGTHSGELEYVEGGQGYTLVGTYSSGTLYNSDGTRRDGWFATDILDVGDNVVYWLVERSPGIGAEIKPENQVILITREGTTYTNNSQSLDGSNTSCTKQFYYKDDRVVSEEVENTPVEGPGSAMFSTVRIAKWAGSYDSDGTPTNTYTPLGNATFDIYVAHADGTLVEKIDTITAGLDNDLNGTQAEGLTAWASSRAYAFDTLKKDYEEENREGVAQDVIWTDASSGDGYVRLILVETSTPGGYNLPTRNYPMLLYFRHEENKTTETFSDVFYVKGADTDEPLANTISGSDWPLYATQEKKDGTYEVVKNGEQYRLVNWPVNNFAVTVTKYGYPVTDDTLGKTSQKLDEYYLTHTGRVPLRVTMKLQRYSPTQGWSDCVFDDSSTTTFTTNDNGYFAFPNGLGVGRYRIIETTKADGYENIYNGDSLAGDDFYSAKAYYFTVTNSNVAITMYNPQELSIQIRKMNMEGDPLNGATFQLSGAATKTAATGADDGIATFQNLTTGNYILSETTAPAGYSKGYLNKYFQATYTNDLKNFAASGIFLGFTTELKENQMVVTDVTDLSDYGITGTLTLDVPDPELGQITIVKTSQADGNTKLQGAQFQVSRKDFASWDGEEELTDNDWSTPTTHTTDENGTVLLSNLEPGIYKITETVPPEGYDLTGEDTQYVVLTGGMNKNVTWTGRVTHDTDNSATVTFENPPKVDLTVTKKLSSGDLTVEGNHEITIKLLNGKKEEIDSKKIIISEGSNSTFNQQVTFEDLTQGETYYLQEECGTEFALTEVTGADDGLVITPDTSGTDTLYPFTVPEKNAAISIEMTNTYLWGELIILKVDGTDGTALKGAAFEGYRKQAEGENFYTNNSAQVEELTTKGEYRIRLPLRVEGDTYKIQEISPPAGYLREYPKTEVTLKPGQKIEHGNYDKATMGTGNRAEDDAAMLKELIFPNYQGAVIELTKYGGTRENASARLLEGVEFTLYSKVDGQWSAVETLKTNFEGQITFTVEGGKEYAIREGAVPNGYQGLQGVWNDSSGQPLDKESVPTQTGGTATYFVLGSLQSGQTYSYSAYNTPWLELEIRKEDALNPEGQTAPTAVVSVYEVPADTSDTLTQSQVAELMTTGTLVLENVSVNTPGSEGTEHYTYANKDTLPTLGTSIVPGKTYLVVETSSSYTQLRDNKNVQWYKVLSIPAGATGKQIVTLKNISGSASQTLVKTTETDNYAESPMSQSLELKYTITPSVTNTYPLDSFVLEDTGLTAYHESMELRFEDYLKDKYSITQVSVGQATHNAAGYTDAEAPIKATVTFYDFDGQEIEERTVDVSVSQQTVSLTDTTKKVKNVQVAYRAEALDNSGYDLGLDFQPGPVELTVVLDQQTGGETVQSITKVTNQAKTTMVYRPWSTEGFQLEAQTVTETAKADNTFGALKAAKVSVTKGSNVNEVDLANGEVLYTVQISNAAGSAAPMQNPFLVDLLPQGMVVPSDPQISLVAPPEGISIENSRTETQDGETALFVFLKGDLNPGDSVKVQFRLNATQSLAMYGADVVNYVLVGTREAGVQSADNPCGSSFQTENGQWPQNVDGTLTSLNPERRNTLKKILANSQFETFGYIATNDTIHWSAQSEAALVKLGRGDRSQDLGFTSNRLATVNNNGYMEYQLVFSNLSANYSYTNVTLLDVLPYAGDKEMSSANRGSAWGMEFGGVTSVTYQGDDSNRILTKGTDYQVFYYTTPINDDNIVAVYQDAEQLKFDKTPLPGGWSDTPEPEVYAIAIAVKKDAGIALDTNESYVVQYRLNVGELNQDELQDRSWTNAVNSFVCQFWRYTDDINQAEEAHEILSSNSVSNTILPETVQVGGHIWIDKDADGVWEKGESVSDLASNRMVQNLLRAAEIRLNSYEGTGGSASGIETYSKTGTWTADANFIFDGLDPARAIDSATEASLYSGTGGGRLRLLNPAYLKGQAPRTYSLVVTIPENSGVLASATTLGATTGYSREPAQLAPGEKYAGEAKDNNFGVASDRSFVSERFFLHPTSSSVFDNTKDFGVVLNRNLTLKKVAKDDSSELLEGAEFKIYGPFESVAVANAATLSDANLVDTVTTSANGEATVKNLNWFQVYVIVETTAPAGYQKDSAEASGGLTEYTGTSTTDPAWILDVPADADTNPDQQFTITNERSVSYTLQATKTLTGKTLTAGSFEFELLNDQMKLVEKKGNDQNGAVEFTTITAVTPGKTTYYIREAIPEEAQQNGNVLDHIHYSTALYKAEVTVTWNAADKKLEEAVAYFQQDDQGQWQNVSNVEFTNAYIPSSVTYQPKVVKQYTKVSATPAAWPTLTFTLTQPNGTAEGVTMPTVTQLQIQGPGESQFDAITFAKAGTYTFEIKEEKIDSLISQGYVFDETVWTLEVVVEDNQGNLEIKSAKYRPDNAQTEADEATFSNQYVLESVTFAPAVKKSITGDQRTEEKTFTFDIALSSEDPKGGVQMPQNTQVQITGEGSASFQNILFISSGTYKFTITEKAGSDRGYTYDDATWTLTVEVAAENSKLKIQNVTYRKNLLTSNETAAEFTNQFEKLPAEYVPVANKSFTSTSDARPSKKTFTFTLDAEKDYPGVEMSLMATLFGNRASVKGEGTVSFGKVTFRQTGVYRFFIREEDGKASGYTYDKTEWILTVTVEERGGQLAVTHAEYATNAKTPVYAERAEFINSYKQSEDDSPKTGDYIGWIFGAFLASGAGLAALAIGYRRRNRKK